LLSLGLVVLGLCGAGVATGYALAHSQAGANFLLDADAETEADVIYVLVSCPGHRVSDDSSAWIGIGPAEGLGDLGVGANVLANLASEVSDRREDAPSQ
jgi:hypothetical protein